MSKSKFIVDKLAKLFEQGLVSYKDLSSEILNILRSKRDEIIFRMKLTSKEEADILNKRIENLEKKIYLFMHHNPLPTGHIKSDELGLQQKEEFKNILIKYKESIKHIFFGHQHITTSGKYLGITFSSPRSTWSPLIPNFSETFRLGTACTDPNYNVILLQNDSLIVHSEDFLKTNVTCKIKKPNKVAITMLVSRIEETYAISKCCIDHTTIP